MTIAEKISELDEEREELEERYCENCQEWCCDNCWAEWRGEAREILNSIQQLPFAQPEIKLISYQDCSNAMLKMWIDNVLTDGEYNRIMEKLNSKHMTDMRGAE